MWTTRRLVQKNAAIIVRQNIRFFILILLGPINTTNKKMARLGLRLIAKLIRSRATNKLFPRINKNNATNNANVTNPDKRFPLVIKNNMG